MTKRPKQRCSIRVNDQISWRAVVSMNHAGQACPFFPRDLVGEASVILSDATFRIVDAASAMRTITVFDLRIP